MSLQSKLREVLVKEEGRCPYGYEDTEGYLTIGVGHLIDKRRGGQLPYHIVEALLDSDIDNVFALLDVHLPWWRTRTEPAQMALAQMVFQLGINGVTDFSKMLSCLHAGDYEGAQRNALDSKWAQEQTPERAQRVCALFTEKEA